MFEVSQAENGVIRLSGRCDAASSSELARVLDEVTDSAVLDFSDLTYISSDPLGVLFATQKRLLASDKALRLVHLSPHIREVFSIAGFDAVFQIEDGAS